MTDIIYGWVEFFLVILVAMIVFAGYTIVIVINKLVHWFNQRKRRKVTNTNRKVFEKNYD